MAGQLCFVLSMGLAVVVVLCGGRLHVADHGRHMRIDGGRSGGRGRRVVGVHAHCELMCVCVGLCASLERV